MSAPLKLSFIIEAIDRATAPVRAVNARIEQVTEPVRRVRASFNALLQESHLPRLASQAKLIGDKFQGVTGAVRGLAGAAFAVAGIGGAGGALWAGLKHIIDSKADMAETAKMVGMTSREFGRLSYALSLDGGSAEDAAMAIKFLQKNAIEALSGNRDMAQWFRRAGISAAELEKILREGGIDELLNRMSDAIAKLPENAMGNAMGMDMLINMMGRGGNRLLETMRKGRQGLKEIGDEGERLRGRGVGGAAFKEASDNLHRMQTAIGGVIGSVAGAALPAVNKIAKSVIEWAVANRELIATRAAEWFERLVQSLPEILETAKRITVAIGALIVAADQVVQFFSGWSIVFEAWAAILGIKAVVAVFGLCRALLGMIPIIYSVGAALLATPIGWFIGAVALLAGAAYLIYKNWEPIKRFFVELWDTIKEKILKLDAITPDWVKKWTLPGAALSLAANAVRADRAPVAAPGAAGRAEVGGTINLKIDSAAPVRVTSMQTDNSNVDFDIYSGPLMVGP